LPKLRLWRRAIERAEINLHRETFLCILAPVLFAGITSAQQTVSFPNEDGGEIYADVYGEGARGVVLGHGGSFNKANFAAPLVRIGVGRCGV